MEVKLTPKESEEYFHNALCNGAGELVHHGVQLDWDEKDYKLAKESLKTKEPNKGICIEDVLLEILRIGKKLSINDLDGDGEYNRSIELKDVHNRVEKTPLHHLTAMIEEQDDADTADAILQTVFFEELIFG